MDRKVIRVGARCRMCSKVVTLDLTDEEFVRYQAWEQRKMLIQDALPNVSPEVREVFISGTCGECWNRMFEGFDDMDEEEA